MGTGYSRLCYLGKRHDDPIGSQKLFGPERACAWTELALVPRLKRNRKMFRLPEMLSIYLIPPENNPDRGLKPYSHLIIFHGLEWVDLLLVAASRSQILEARDEYPASAQGFTIWLPPSSHLRYHHSLYTEA